MTEEQEIQKSTSDWGAHGKEDSFEADEFIGSQYDHKIWIGKSKLPLKLKHVRQLLQKDLSFSRIDRAAAYYFSIYLSVAEDYVTQGLYDSAMEVMVKLMGKLALMRSIGGFERINQNEAIASSIQYDMTDEQLDQVNQPMEEEAQVPRRPSMMKKLFRTAAGAASRRR